MNIKSIYSATCIKDITNKHWKNHPKIGDKCILEIFLDDKNNTVYCIKMNYDEGGQFNSIITKSKLDKHFDVDLESKEIIFG